MPLVKRCIEPIHISRDEIPKGVKNELEAVTVNTLSGVILQLSSLAKHAENVFAELFIEATNIYSRTCHVHERVGKLSVKVTQLDSAGEEISLQDINMQKAFKMTIHSDQQVVSRSTLPDAMLGNFKKCDPVPDLNSLNIYRIDGKEGLKFYTNPTYFFELWYEKMSEEFEKRKRKKKRAQRNRNNRDENKTVTKVRKKQVKPNVPDWEIRSTEKKQNVEVVASPSKGRSASQMSDVLPPPPPSSLTPEQSPSHRYSKRLSTGSNIERPSRIAPPPPPGDSGSHRSSMISPVPPPPPPPGPGGMSPFPPPPPPSHSLNDSFPAPPLLSPGGSMPPPPPGMSPPPPPPPQFNAAPAPPPPPPMSMGTGGGCIPPPPSTASSSLPPPPPPDQADDEDDEPTRDGLLTAIRQGMALKKVQERNTQEKKQESSAVMDVASILARRIAVELSDSDGDDDDDYSDDDDEWDD